MFTLQQIQGEVDRLARRVGVAKEDLPTYGRETSRDVGYPHIEVDGSGYHYVVIERGDELDRKSTEHLPELLYWIFRDATHSMAFAYELNHRIEDQDCRRIAFPKQIELMSAISAEMGERAFREIQDVLRVAPYDDEPIRAVNRMKHSNAT
jgi:hypothetical protein